MDRYYYKIKADNNWYLNPDQPISNSRIDTTDNILDMKQLPMYVKLKKKDNKIKKILDNITIKKAS